jgi:hypothetical protein
LQALPLYAELQVVLKLPDSGHASSGEHCKTSSNPPSAPRYHPIFTNGTVLPSGQTTPGTFGQVMQPFLDVIPAERLHLPEGQKSQFVEAFCSVKRPGGHKLQETFQYFPAEHDIHPWSVGMYPKAQLLQSCESIDPSEGVDVPIGQEMQADNPWVGAYFPNEQLEQTVEPFAAANVPFGHEKHFRSLKFENFPPGQSEHDVEPVKFEVLPAGQYLQVPLTWWNPAKQPSEQYSPENNKINL